MTTNDQILSYLCGYTPISMRGQDIPVPTDQEIYAYILDLPSHRQKLITAGPFGQEFKRKINEALSRIKAEERMGKPLANGSMGSSFLPKWDPSEVLKNMMPRKFKTDEDSE